MSYAGRKWLAARRCTWRRLVVTVEIRATNATAATSTPVASARVRPRAAHAWRQANRKRDTGRDQAGDRCSGAEQRAGLRAARLRAARPLHRGTVPASRSPSTICYRSAALHARPEVVSATSTMEVGVPRATAVTAEGIAIDHAAVRVRPVIGTQSRGELAHELSMRSRRWGRAQARDGGGRALTRWANFERPSMARPPPAP